MGGTLYARGCPAGTFPVLAAVGGYLNAQGCPAGTFPVLTAVGDTLYAQGCPAGTFPVLTAVGGYLDAQGCPAGTFPVLAAVGGTLVARGCPAGTFDHIKQNDATAASKCRSVLDTSFASNGLTFADNILAAVVSKRGNVTIIRICGQTKNSYLISDGDRHAHGATLTEARASLKFKIGDRDASQYKKWTKKKMASLVDMVIAYRVITGACELGVRQFLSTHKVPKKLSVAAAIDLTRGAYGNEAFEKFFSK